MVQTYLTAQPGTSMGIGRMIAAMSEYKEQLLFVIKLHHPDRFSFVAIFREPNSVGGFTALIDHGGATSGYNGGGPWAHAQMLTFLEDHSVEVKDAYWSDWESDYPDFTVVLHR